MRNFFLCLLPVRESKKSGAKKEEKKRKPAGADKDKERGGGNDSFKSREFIETSEESSSDSDRKSKSKRKKVKLVMINVIARENTVISLRLHNCAAFLVAMSSKNSKMYRSKLATCYTCTFKCLCCSNILISKW